MGKRKPLLISIISKALIFISPKLGEIGRNRIKFNKIFTKTIKIPSLYIYIYIITGKAERKPN